MKILTANFNTNAPDVYLSVYHKSVIRIDGINILMRARARGRGFGSFTKSLVLIFHFHVK